MDITELLTFTVQQGASDLHLSSGLPPILRIDGEIHRLKIAELDHDRVHDMVYNIMTDGQKRSFERDFQVDFSFELLNVARFRVNAFMQDRGAAAAFRVIPENIMTLDDINAPDTFVNIVNVRNGLVLVTGVTGSGKSTTLAAMVHHLNKTKPLHILTIEDPIEFVHKNIRSLVNQRELHTHTESFEGALRAALREDPDVILVGEMRDLETIRLALTAAETGHLVFGTLHTSSAVKTIDRVVDVFPGEEKSMVRAMLSNSLRAVISQSLLRKKSGSGRIAVWEVMIATPAIRNLIRENKLAQMYSSIQMGQAEGMQTMDQHLKKLVQDEVVDIEEALFIAERKEEL